VTSLGAVMGDPRWWGASAEWRERVVWLVGEGVAGRPVRCGVGGVEWNRSCQNSEFGDVTSNVWVGSSAVTAARHSIIDELSIVGVRSQLSLHLIPPFLTLPFSRFC